MMGRYILSSHLGTHYYLYITKYVTKNYFVNSVFFFFCKTKYDNFVKKILLPTAYSSLVIHFGVDVKSRLSDDFR